MTEEELFEAARHIRDAFERVAYLNCACAADPPMRQRVEALLRSDAEARGFLEEPLCPHPIENLAGASRDDCPNHGPINDVSRMPGHDAAAGGRSLSVLLLPDQVSG